MEVNAYVKAVVVPIRMVFAAPLTVSVHSSHIAAYRSALVAKSGCVAIDLGAIGLQPAMTIVGPVSIRSRRGADSKEQTSR